MAHSPGSPHPPPCPVEGTVAGPPSTSPDLWGGGGGGIHERWVFSDLISVAGLREFTSLG